MLSEFVERSRGLANDALRRAYIHMAMGIAIGLVGLVFFFVSTSAMLPHSGTSATWQSLAMLGIAALPRIGVLVFIEITAGFFLKQYASAMEEFRYFERIQRHREAELLSFVLRHASGLSESMAEFANLILAGSQVGILKTGESTATLEAERATVNDVEHLLSTAIEGVRGVRLKT